MNVVFAGTCREDLSLQHGIRKRGDRIEHGHFSANSELTSGTTILEGPDGQTIVEVGPRENGHLYYGTHIWNVSHVEHGFYQNEFGLKGGLLYRDDTLSFGNYGRTTLENGIFIDKESRISSGEFEPDILQLKEGHRMWEEVPGHKIYERGHFGLQGLEGYGIHVSGNYIQQGNFIEGKLTAGVSLALYSVSYDTMVGENRFHFRLDKESRTIYVSTYPVSSGPLQVRYELNFDDIDPEGIVVRRVSGDEVTRYKLVKCN